MEFKFDSDVCPYCGSTEMTISREGYEHCIIEYCECIECNNRWKVVYEYARHIADVTQNSEHEARTAKKVIFAVCHSHNDDCSKCNFNVLCDYAKGETDDYELAVSQMAVALTTFDKAASRMMQQ